MMVRRLFLLSLFSSTILQTSNAINFSKINVAWQYDMVSEIRMDHRVFQKNGINNIFLSIQVDSLSLWEYEFLVQDGYESEDHRKIHPLSIDTLISNSKQLNIQIQLPKIEENLLVIKNFKRENFYYYDIRLRIGVLPYPSIYPIDNQKLPILKNYINRSGFTWVGSISYHAMEYTDNYSLSDPPMADMKPLAPKGELNTSFIFTDLVNFNENFFYVVREDSSASVGVTMLRTPPYFPKYRQLSELIESMLYLTNELERKSLLKSKNRKQSFDSFWMNNFTTKSEARNAIRRYYNRVEAANLKFTDFKPGWKTDRGMILIVFGMPDEVYRTVGSEEWHYDAGNVFEFTIISSFFASRTYSLRRNKNLEKIWYQNIAAIRSGINE